MPHPNGQLTAEEIAPSEEDYALATKLIAEGYKSVSTKNRYVARMPFSVDVSFEPMEMRYWIDQAVRLFSSNYLRIHAKPITLTVRQFRAFKLLGGQVG